MSPRPVLSPEERDLVLRELRRDSSGVSIPIRTSPGGPAAGAEGPAGPRPPSPPGRPPPKGKSPLVPPRPPRRRRRTLLIILLLLLLLLGLTGGKLLSVGSSVLSPERSILRQLADLLLRRSALKGEKENRVNILLVAIGGEGHQGKNLADTIILASLRPREGDVALFSIPRDLYVKIPETGLYSRINAVHAYGENQRKGEGLRILREKVQEVTGQEVHYIARVDFIAFKRIVDEIGGIEITIPNGFYDYWHRINFPEGTEHMNGERALAYVRARFIEGREGGDFKRAARTQQVLLAIRKKVLSVQTAVDLRALAGILDALRDNVATNFTLAELKRLADLARGIPDDQIRSAVLSTGTDGLLVGTTEILGGKPASVLRPKAGTENYEDIRAFAADIFAKADAARPPATAEGAPPTPSAPAAAGTPSPPPRSVAEEEPTLDVRNGTNVTGLASRVAKALEKKEFNVLAVGNAALRNRTQTVLVDRTGGKKPSSLKALQETLGVTTTATFPETEKTSTDANFVVFLGTDVSEKFRR